MTTPQQTPQIFNVPFTVEQMRAAFEPVQSKNWKDPIDAIIDRAAIEVTREAVIWFAGCRPTFEHLRDGRVRVRAIGYYAAVGA